MKLKNLISSFFLKIFFLISSTILILVLVFEYFSFKSQEQSLIDVMYSKTITIAKSITLVSSDAMVTDDSSYIVEHLQKVLADNNLIKYTLVTKNRGDTLCITQDNWAVLSTVPESIEAIRTRDKKSQILMSEITSEAVYHVSFPVIFTGIEWGWVDIGYSVEQYNEDITSLYESIVIYLVVVLGISLIYSFTIAKWIVKPVLLLNNAAQDVANGNFDTKVSINSQDEVGQLSDSFNYMIKTLKVSDEKLRKSNEELEERVRQRTYELSVLNQELDYKVKEEVAKQSQQEKILIQQSRFAAMGEMIANIAHQWRQPLNAMGLIVQNLETAYEMNIVDEKYINRVIDKSNRLLSSMSHTIDDFRNFFKPNKEVEVFSINSAIEVSMDIIQTTLDNNMIQVVKNLDSNINIVGFSSEFSQVILNILGNANDALVEKNDVKNRCITVNITRENNYAFVKISDNAGGIDEAIIDDVFDPYFTTKEEGKGTGIGLYMSKMIIENNMDGSLMVENENEGATFLIKIALSIEG